MGTHSLLAAVGGLFVAALFGSGCTAARIPSAGAGELADSYYRVGIEHLAADRHRAALRELNAARLVRPEDPLIHRALGSAYRGQGRAPLSVWHLTRALELDPELTPARLEVAEFYLETARPRAAMDHLRRVLEDLDSPDRASAQASLGWAQLMVGDLAAARSSLEISLALDSSQPQVLLRLGVLERLERNEFEALSLFEQALTARPGGAFAAEANYRTAELLLALGERDAALCHLAAAARSPDPGDGWDERARTFLALLHE